NLDGRHVGLLEVPGHCLIHALWLDEFHQAELRGVVAVLFLGAALHHDTGAGLQHGYADEVAVRGEHLGHAQLDSDDSVDCHLCLSLSSLPFRYRLLYIVNSLPLVSGYQLSAIRYQEPKPTSPDSCFLITDI